MNLMEADPAWRRLHWATMPMQMIRSIRVMIVPIVVILFFRSRGGEEQGRAFGALGSAGVFALITVAIALWRYFSLRFYVGANELVIETGLIGRSVRHIKLEQVQDLRTSQGVLQRMIGVSDVKVETAGTGGGSEAELSVLSLKDVADLRAKIERFRLAKSASFIDASIQPGNGLPTGTDPQPGALPAISSSTSPPEELLRSVSTKELIVAGLTSNRVLSGLVVIGVTWGLLNDFIPEREMLAWVESMIMRLKNEMTADTSTRVIIALLGTVLLISLGVISSVVGTIVRFHGYQLRRSTNATVKGLVRESGLFTRRSSTLTVDRVQTLTFRQGVLRRLIGRMSVHAATAAGMSDRDKDSTDLLLPIARTAEAASLATIVFPERGMGSVTNLSRADRSTVRRSNKKTVVLVLLALIALVMANRSPWSMLVLAAIPILFLANRRSWRVSGHQLDDQLDHERNGPMLHLRTGLIGLSYRLMPARNSQVILLTQSPFDRHYGVARLHIDTAGEQAGNGVSVGPIPVSGAVGLAMKLARQASMTTWPGRRRDSRRM